MGGTYNEKVTVNVSGTSGNYITFTNFANQDVTLDGTGVSGSTMLDISDKDYLIFSGLNIKNCIGNYSIGILITGASHHIEIRDNKISNIHFSSDPNAPVNSSKNSQPLIVFGTNVTTAISNLIIDGNRDTRNPTIETSGTDVIFIDGASDGTRLKNLDLINSPMDNIYIVVHENQGQTQMTDDRPRPHRHR